MTDDAKDALNRLKEKMLEEKTELEERLSGVNQVIKSIHQIENVLTSMDRSSSVRLARRLGLPGTETKGDASSLSLVDQMIAVEMSDMTLEDAMITYARAQGGIFNSYRARPLLEKAGLLKGTAGSISSRLHEALSSSVYFEPLGDKKGRWKLARYKMDDDSPL